MPIVSAISMVSQADLNHNLQQAEELIQAAAGQHAQLVVLPENFAFMSQDELAKLNIAEDFGTGPIQHFLSDMAKTYQLVLVGGTTPLKTADVDKVTATTLTYGPDGKLLSRYDKIHLFDVTVNANEQYRESYVIQAGQDPVTTQTDFGYIGMSVCYDLRFPELYRRLLSLGACMMVVPSAFTFTTGQTHWEILLRARAIENLAFVIGANQAGEHYEGRKTWGHSMIISPWGDVLAVHAEGPGIATADINLEHLHQLRKQFPATEHRRLR